MAFKRTGIPKLVSGKVFLESVPIKANLTMTKVDPTGSINNPNMIIYANQTTLLMPSRPNVDAAEWMSVKTKVK